MVPIVFENGDIGHDRVKELETDSNAAQAFAILARGVFGQPAESCVPIVRDVPFDVVMKHVLEKVRTRAGQLPEQRRATATALVHWRAGGRRFGASASSRLTARSRWCLPWTSTIGSSQTLAGKTFMARGVCCGARWHPRLLVRAFSSALAVWPLPTLSALVSAITILE